MCLRIKEYRLMGFLNNSDLIDIFEKEPGICFSSLLIGTGWWHLKSLANIFVNVSVRLDWPTETLRTASYGVTISQFDIFASMAALRMLCEWMKHYHAHSTLQLQWWFSSTFILLNIGDSHTQAHRRMALGRCSNGHMSVWLLILPYSLKPFFKFVI